MVKFVITEEAMSPIAQALSGQSRMAGVAAGLKNQMLGMELDKMREERQQAERQRQMRNDLIPNRIRQMFGDYSPRVQNRLAERLGWQNPNPEASPNLLEEYNDAVALQKAMSLPQWANAQRYADAVHLNDAFGGNGLEAIKGIGLAQDNANKEYYDMAARAASAAGDRDMFNQMVAARNGDVYNPYRTDSNGLMYNSSTGRFEITPIGQANLGNIQAQTNERNAHTGLYVAQTGTEGLKQQGLAIDNQGKLVRLEELQNPQAKPPSQVYKPLPAAAVESVFGMDGDAYQAFQLEMARKGYADENEYLPIYLREMEGRKAAGNIVGNAMGGVSTNSPTAQAALNAAGNPPSTWQRGLQAVLPVMPGVGITAGGLGLMNNAAQANGQPTIPVPLKPEALAGQPPTTPMPYLDARFNRAAVNTPTPSATPGFSWMLTNNIRNPRLPEKAVDSSKYIDTAPAGGWLNPNLGNAALESNKQMLFNRLGITPNMTPEQIEQQIVLGISKNMIDDASASQLNRMLFGQ
ncbi:hypothetical protein [Eikenella corrodens]|uniref:hypothetical protein n=1 Tax=Eikenella corrodens TaxID=539 RepID=UPI00129BC225|nr:hypothetical protein [Eikenella corrodens]